MTRSFLSGLFALAWAAFSACVPPLHYELVDHGANGHSVSGTIITDGSIGNLTVHNIIGWEYTVTGPTSWSANSNQMDTCVQPSLTDPLWGENPVIEADAKRIVMSGDGWFHLRSQISAPVAHPQYGYRDGGTIAIDPLLAQFVWNAQDPGNELVFATTPVASTGEPLFSATSPANVCQ